MHLRRGAGHNHAGNRHVRRFRRPVSPRHVGDALRIISSLKGGTLPSPVENRFTFGGYLDHIDKPLGTSMAFLVNHGMIRAAVMGF